MADDYTPRFDLIMDQGATFTHAFNWYGGGKFMSQVEDVRCGYPTQVKVTGHGLPDVSETPVIIEGVEGSADRINSHTTGVLMCKRVDDDWFAVPVNTAAMSWTPGTGGITYYIPADLVGWECRMQIRKRWNSPDVIHEANIANGQMTIDTEDASINIFIPHTVTEVLNFSEAVYDIEIYQTDGVVTRLVEGRIINSKEVTR